MRRAGRGAGIALAAWMGALAAQVVQSAEHAIILTLGEAIAQALETSPAITDARLARRLERYDAEQAARHFAPEWSWGTNVASARYEEAGGTHETGVEGGPKVSVRLRHGGEVALGTRWTHTLGGGDGEGRRRQLTAKLTQPLGRGAGAALARAPVTRSALAQEQSRLALRAMVMDVVTGVVNDYTALMRATLAREIEHDALAEARNARRIVEALVGAGRLARSERTQSEAEVAERTLGAARSEEAEQRARAALARTLGLGPEVQIHPTERPPARAGAPPDTARSLAQALAHAPAYARAQVALRQAALERTVARDATRWDVALEAEARIAGERVERLARARERDGAYRIALTLNIPFDGGRGSATERARIAAETAYAQAAGALAQARRTLESEVREAVEGVRSSARRIELADEALGLARASARIEQGKLARGRASSQRAKRARADEAQAARAALDARIGHMKARATLERAQGTVLEHWRITLDETRVRATMAREVPEPAGRRRADARLMLRLGAAPIAPRAGLLRLKIGAGGGPARGGAR